MFPVLIQCPLFRGLKEDMIESLLKETPYTTASFKKGDVIARRDMAYSGLMIILEGSVQGEIANKKGKRRVIDNIPAGQLIAPAFLFGGYNRLPVDVVADEDDTQIMIIHRGPLFEIMQNNTLVLSNFIDIISNRANYFSRKIYALTVLMLKEKVAALLMDAVDENNSDTIKLDISAMADELDVTRLNIEQTLAELERRKIIKVSGDSVKLLNKKALETVAYS